MLRSNHFLRKAAATTSLADAFSNARRVWNLSFDDDRVITEELVFHEDRRARPIFHITDLAGSAPGTLGKDANGDEAFRFPVNGAEDALPRAVAERAMRTMLQHNVMDKILLEAQRQGRISFYMTQFGEEGALFGAAAGLADHDELFTQYREAGILTYRGYTIPQFIAQAMGNCEDNLKGRQMPMHFGSRALHAQVPSSPLATQVPHGAGAGYAIRLENEERLAREPDGADLATLPEARICATFMGEGACSEGDFHAAVNFAATVGAHTLFFVRNNGYAISTPTREQYAGDGILGRAIGYGVPAARVDGMDFLAVYHAVRQARRRILRESRPCFLEAITYRVSHHSTSDDSTAYRSPAELEQMKAAFDPIARLERLLLDLNWWTKQQSDEVMEASEKAIMREIRRQEKLPPWPVESMLSDVLEHRTPHLEKQREELIAHYGKYKDVYEAEKP